MSWKILIERGNLGFSAAHFITFEDDCEPLHGHNYGVRVEVAGELGPESYVLDFLVLKNIVRVLCKDWDHRFLLPLQNPHLRVTELSDAWELEYLPARPSPEMAARGHLRYLLPKWSVVPLPIPNATAERLAQLLAERIAVELRARGQAHTLTSLQVGIEETEMQAAFYTLTLREDASRERPPGT
ncbi:MAG: 6-pyruvoyl tetrahydropterin synthase family protein [Ktedonobacterales bacterium]|nr:6-pyruvoyl tetrahydropterin synthase family protein [Ktedonobacterales bacterium]